MKTLLAEDQKDKITVEVLDDYRRHDKRFMSIKFKSIPCISCISKLNCSTGESRM